MDQVSWMKGKLPSARRLPSPEMAETIVAVGMESVPA
jgi:hypothetical protein